MDLGYDCKEILINITSWQYYNITRMALSSKYVKLKKDISTTIHALTYEQALYILCASWLSVWTITSRKREVKQNDVATTGTSKISVHLWSAWNIEQI